LFRLGLKERTLYVCNNKSDCLVLHSVNSLLGEKRGNRHMTEVTCLQPSPKKLIKRADNNKEIQKISLKCVRFVFQLLCRNKSVSKCCWHKKIHIKPVYTTVFSFFFRRLLRSHSSLRDFYLIEVLWKMSSHCIFLLGHLRKMIFLSRKQRAD